VPQGKERFLHKTFLANGRSSGPGINFTNWISVSLAIRLRIYIGRRDHELSRRGTSDTRIGCLASSHSQTVCMVVHSIRDILTLHSVNGSNLGSLSLSTFYETDFT
jgi:hypothetical protein